MKNPLVQMALPMALTYAAGPIGAKLGGMGLFKGMSPLMANALKQSALGFGTAALSGSKRPWKGAMYAGLTSIPFSYMSSARAADAFNQQYADAEGWEKFVSSDPKDIYSYMEPDPAADFFPAGQRVTGRIPATYQFKKSPVKIPKVSAWDVATGKQDVLGGAMSPTRLDDYYSDSKAAALDDYTRTLAAPGSEGKYRYGKLIPGEKLTLPDASIFSKPVKVDGIPTSLSEADWIPTAASQAAALYGGRDTPEERWEAARKKRKKELAWMYGVPEDMIEGEMLNPWYSGGMFNSGGIASLDMSYGGDVSGPGGPKDDMIDAKLSDGEFVMTAKAVENFGGGDRYEGARKMYDMMNMVDPESETMQEVV